MLIFVLAQTVTAVPVSATNDLQTQLTQAIVVLAGAFLAAVVATVKAWIEKRVAKQLTSIAINGVENSGEAIPQELLAYLGEEKVKALTKAGVDLGCLSNALVSATKKSIKTASLAAGTEPALAAEVARVTSASLPAVDSEENPVKKKE